MKGALIGRGDNPTHSPESHPTQKWEAVVAVLRTHYHDPDIQAARVLYSAVAAHGLAGQPVWPMAVAPPGSMKSELITALDGMPDVSLVDALTPKTLLSGQIPDEKTTTTRSASLLHRIGKSGIILIPDFSTVQSMKSEDRGTVLAALRKIYDGKFSKEFGTAEKVEAWEGRITVVVGTTPEFDRQRAVSQALGERFVMVRWQRAGLEAAKRAIVQDGERAHTDLRRVVQDLLLNLQPGEIEISLARQDQIVALAEIAVLGRTHVNRHPSTKALLEDPEPESPTRLAQQLCQLAKGSARIGGRRHVNEEDFAVAKRAAFDCIPPRRREILLAVVEHRTPETKTSNARYAREDLQAVGLLDGANRLTGKSAKLFKSILTISPPRAKRKRDAGVGGTSSAKRERGR